MHGPYATVISAQQRTPVSQAPPSRIVVWPTARTKVSIFAFRLTCILQRIACWLGRTADLEVPSSFHPRRTTFSLDQQHSTSPPPTHLPTSKVLLTSTGTLLSKLLCLASSAVWIITSASSALSLCIDSGCSNQHYKMGSDSNDRYDVLEKIGMLGCRPPPFLDGYNSTALICPPPGIPLLPIMVLRRGIDHLAHPGHGSFGIIRKVRRKEDGMVLCRKEISYLKMSQKEREQLHAEFTILSSLRHSNIVGYYSREHLKTSQDLHIYMEYCGNGDLGRVIRDLQAKNQYAEEAFVWSIFSQLVTALYRCHYGIDPPEVGKNVMGLGPSARPKTPVGGMTILHRDLKPENSTSPASNQSLMGEETC